MAERNERGRKKGDVGPRGWVPSFSAPFVPFGKTGSQPQGVGGLSGGGRKKRKTAKEGDVGPKGRAKALSASFVPFGKTSSQPKHLSAPLLRSCQQATEDPERLHARTPAPSLADANHSRNRLVFEIGDASRRLVRHRTVRLRPESGPRPGRGGRF